MRQFIISLEANNEAVKRSEVSGRDLHRAVFSHLQRVDAVETAVLRNSQGMRPFTLFPLYNRERELAGLRLHAFNKETSQLFDKAWRTKDDRERAELEIAGKSLKVADISIRSSPRFADLINQPPAKTVTLHFLTATAFHVHKGDLLLPVPRNIFARPFQVWQEFAPPMLALPRDWLDWCEENVLVTRHRIRTVRAAIDEQNWQAGFVGLVSFRAFDGEAQETELYRRVFQALGRFAAYSGVGRKTTMGMGHCDFRRSIPKPK